MMSTFPVTQNFSVVCFHRDGTGPYFAVREWDTKVIRSQPADAKSCKSHIKGLNRSSEQAIRASIRQAILNMGLQSERATKDEIRLLKLRGILGKRAPSCSLLCGGDMIRLLLAFGQETRANELKAALSTYYEKTPISKPKRKKVAEVKPTKKRSASHEKPRHRLELLLSAVAATSPEEFQIKPRKRRREDKAQRRKQRKKERLMDYTDDSSAPVTPERESKQLEFPEEKDVDPGSLSASPVPSLRSVDSLPQSWSSNTISVTLTPMTADSCRGVKLDEASVTTDHSPRVNGSLPFFRALPDASADQPMPVRADAAHNKLAVVKTENAESHDSQIKPSLCPPTRVSSE